MNLSRLTLLLSMLTYAGAVVTLLLASPALGQSSSLYVDGPEPVATPEPTGADRPSPLAPAVARGSLIAVTMPEPRRFSIHDLIFITVRESSESRFDASLETEKETGLEGDVTAFPTFTLSDLLELRFKSKDFSEDPNRPRVQLGFEREFEGEGESTRSDVMTARVAARVIDIRPNGNLVLEARKHLRTDEESVTILLTGTCRPIDVNPDNTLDSYKLYDLHLVKITDGEVHKAATKGVFTKLLDLLFNF